MVTLLGCRSAFRNLLLLRLGVELRQELKAYFLEYVQVLWRIRASGCICISPPGLSDVSEHGGEEQLIVAAAPARWNGGHLEHHRRGLWQRELLVQLRKVAFL